MHAHLARPSSEIHDFQEEEGVGRGGGLKKDANGSLVVVSVHVEGCEEGERGGPISQSPPL